MSIATATFVSTTLNWFSPRNPAHAMPASGQLVLCYCPWRKQRLVVAECRRTGAGTRFSTVPGGWQIALEYVEAWAELPKTIEAINENP